MTHTHTHDLRPTSEHLQFKSSELYLLATLREGESESERESSKGHQEVDPVRKMMLFCLWEGTSSRGWETALFLKSSFSANGLSERKTLTERETPNAISPMSYSVTFVSRSGKEREREMEKTLSGWAFERSTAMNFSLPRENNSIFTSPTNQVLSCIQLGVTNLQFGPQIHWFYL